SFSLGPGGASRPIRSREGPHRPGGRPGIAERIASGYSDVVLPVGKKIDQFSGQPPRVKVAPSRAYLVILRVGPFDVWHDLPILRREPVLDLPQGNVVRLLGRGSG